MAVVKRTGIKSTAIQSPTDDADNHGTVIRQLKECVEIGQRLRGDLGDSFVRVNELVSAGIIRLVAGTIQAPNTNSPPGSAVPATRQILGDDSIIGGGDLTADRTLTLDGDAGSPGNDKYYGTDSGGAKGFFDLPSGGGSSPLTTKGDILTYDTADARLPVGSDGQIIYADSTQAKGIKWAAAPSGGSTVPALRGSVISNSSASSYTLTFPGGTAAGDLAILFYSHGWIGTTPSGWTQLDRHDASNVNGAAFSKALSSGDISTGSVTISFSGTFDGVVGLVVYQTGTYSDIGVIQAVQSGVSTGSQSFPIGLLSPNVIALTYGGARGNGVVSFSAGNAPLQTVHAGAASGAMNEVRLSVIKSVRPQKITYADDSTGNYACMLMINGA